MADVADENIPMNKKVTDEKTNVKTKTKSASSVVVKWVAIFAAIAIVFIIITHEGPWWWESKQPETVILTPANVELYRFSDKASIFSNITNTSLIDEVLNVEIWLKNTGDETARDISVFVRVRDQNGNIEFRDILDLTWELLAGNETCSATYTVDYEPADTYLEHTIEIHWDTGMNSYLKKTEL
jgi:hypothetical protein